MRNLMYPNTALQLNESKKNNLKDFLSVAGIFGVTHMMLFTKTETANYLRICKNPGGPTLTFKIKKYSLARDITLFNQTTKKHTKTYNKSFTTAPLLVMSGFSNAPEDSAMKIVTYMI
jgi:ribosome biogenesis protein SSF1/2